MPDTFSSGNTPSHRYQSPDSESCTITVPYEVRSSRVLPPRKGGYTLNMILFIVTSFTTLIAGSLQAGVNPINEPLRILEGAPFAFTLMLILLTHELGHYLTSRYHRVDASLPYFIPAPNFIGTFGAIIKMRSRLRNRRALIDIGTAGPLAGFLLSIPAVVIGYRLSTVWEEPVEQGLVLGNSLLLKMLETIMIGPLAENQSLVLHPVAFAGWIGLFVTMLNLIPFGQLDGGHITYALLGKRRHWIIGIMTVPLLLFLGYFTGSTIWIVWGVLLFVIRPYHPPVVEAEPGLSPGRVALGWATIVIFIITFIPAPFRLI